MAEYIGSLFAEIFGSHAGLATILISMFPLIEHKGAIPIGMSVDFWGRNALTGGEALLFALLGSCAIVPVLAWIFTPIIKWLKSTRVFRKFGNFIESKIKRRSKSIEDKTKDEKNQFKRTFMKCLAIFWFVAVPLPMTGVWTGTCVAVVIGLNYWQTVLSVVLGNIVSGTIVVAICMVFPEFTTILVYIFFAIIIAMLVIAVVRIFINSRQDKKLQTANEENTAETDKTEKK